MLDHTEGNRTEAAKILGIGATTLWRRLKGTEMDVAESSSPHGPEAPVAGSLIVAPPSPAARLGSAQGSTRC